MPNQYGCCLKNGNWHRTCACRNILPKQCAARCDVDFGCKGYYYISDHCQLVTSSSCSIYFDSSCPNPMESVEGGTGDLREIGACGSVAYAQKLKSSTCYQKGNYKNNKVMC